MYLNNNVAIIKTDKFFYPQYEKSGDVGKHNYVKDMIIEAFRLQEYDIENIDTPEWNPLGKFIKPGDCVLLKPNLVMDTNRLVGAGTECLYTQPSIVAAVLDFVLISLRGKGHIIVGDAPMQNCNFDNLIRTSGYDKLIEYYSRVIPDGILFEFKDFRGVKSTIKNGLVFSNVAETDDVIIDLGKDSEFYGLTQKEYKRLRVTNYDPHIMLEHHNTNRNEYCVNHDVLCADVIINLPKPKTHRKAGVTIALKNLVGINSRKEFLPHHMTGSIKEGGDEYEKTSLLKKVSNIFDDFENYYSQTRKNLLLAVINNILKRTFSLLARKIVNDKYVEGSWSGNDTISKTICDLNKIIFFADKNGVMRNEIQRRYLVIADMIIAGEKEGPVFPSPKQVGIIAIGENPVSFDETIATLMGAIKEKIPTFRHISNPVGNYSILQSKHMGIIKSNVDEWNGKNVNELKGNDLLYFIPAEGWENTFNKNVGDDR